MISTRLSFYQLSTDTGDEKSLIYIFQGGLHKSNSIDKKFVVFHLVPVAAPAQYERTGRADLVARDVTETFLEESHCWLTSQPLTRLGSRQLTLESSRCMSVSVCPYVLFAMR